jgi:hypothetical protein
MLTVRTGYGYRVESFVKSHFIWSMLKVEEASAVSTPNIIAPIEGTFWRLGLRSFSAHTVSDHYRATNDCQYESCLRYREWNGLSQDPVLGGVIQVASETEGEATNYTAYHCDHARPDHPRNSSHSLGVAPAPIHKRLSLRERIGHSDHLHSSVIGTSLNDSKLRMVQL